MYGIHTSNQQISSILNSSDERGLKQLCVLIQNICKLQLTLEIGKTESDRFRGLLKELNTEQIFTIFSHEEVYEYPIDNIPFYITKEKQTIKKDASDSVKQKGENALYCAAKVGNTLILETLLQLGSNPNHGKSGENKALHAAVHHGHEDAVKLLLKYGANINEKACGGYTALEIACSNKKSAIADLLLQNGAYKT